MHFISRFKHAARKKKLGQNMQNDSLEVSSLLLVFTLNIYTYIHIYHFEGSKLVHCGKACVCVYIYIHTRARARAKHLSPQYNIYKYRVH